MPLRQSTKKRLVLAAALAAGLALANEHRLHRSPASGIPPAAAVVLVAPPPVVEVVPLPPVSPQRDAPHSWHH